MDSSNDTIITELFNFQFRPKIHCYILAILVGGLLSILAKLFYIPHQIPATLSGIVIGIAARHIGNYEDMLVDAHLLLSMYIPLLIAKIVYNMDHYLLRKSLTQIFIIGVIGNSAFVFAFGMILSLFQKRDVPLVDVMIISVIIAPNDNPKLPISDGIKNLEILMYGETILGVAVCNVARIIFTAIINRYATKWYQIICLIIRYIGLSIPVGFGCGLVTSLLFRQLYNDSMNAIAAYISAAYFVYMLSEHIVWCNGTLASFITLFMMTKQRTKLHSKTDHDIKLACNVVYALAKTLLTIICIADSIYWLEEKHFLIELVEAIEVYTMGNVIRLIIFLLASPMLSRAGYGFEFASLVTLFWAVQKGPLQLIQVFKLHGRPGGFKHLEKLNFYVVIYVILTSLVNGSTLKILLKAFGLVKLSNKRKANIGLAIISINEIGNKVLSTLKGNQFYSDVNWSVINAHTVVKNPFEEVADQRTKDNIICQVCSAAVPLKPTKDEYNEHLKDVTMKILNAQRVSFLEQHEFGLLTKHDIKILLEAVDIAMDSSNMSINVDDLLSCMSSEKAVVAPNKVQKILTIDSHIKIPRTTHRRKCYNITNLLTFELIICMIVLLDISLPVIRLFLDYSPGSEAALLTTATLCLFCYLAEAILRVVSFANGSLWKDLKYYISNHWNQVDIFVIIVSILNILLSTTCNYDAESYQTCKYLHCIKLVIFFKIIRVFSKLRLVYLTKMERRNELKLMRVFGVAQGIVTSCDEVISMLSVLTEQSNIREMMKINLEQMRAATIQKMGILEKARPSLTTTIKTKQALRCILKHLKQGIRELHSSGLIDAFEFQKLNQSVTLKTKFLSTVRILKVIKPTLIFEEIPWLHDDAELLDFIYSNIKNRLFNDGDVVCEPGDYPEGVYLIVSGYFKVTYYPTAELNERLKLNGGLPCKEFLEYLRFDEVHEDYLSSGNRMGELAYLTNRPHHCSIIAEAPSQVFIISNEILKRAEEISPDPVLGVAARIWKCVLFGLSRRLLLTTSAYQSTAKQEADYALIRAVVPNTDYYNVINVPQVVEDVLLLQGVVVDYNTREIYTAPCALPKHVKKILMPKSGLIERNISTKLMFIPDNNTDEYEMMLSMQNNSELIPDSECAQVTEQMNSKRRFESHLFSFNKPKSGTLTYCHQIMSFSGGVLYNFNDE